jgi:hypothetical protein
MIEYDITIPWLLEEDHREPSIYHIYSIIDMIIDEEGDTEIFAESRFWERFTTIVIDEVEILECEMWEMISNPFGCHLSFERIIAITSSDNSTLCPMLHQEIHSLKAPLYNHGILWFFDTEIVLMPDIDHLVACHAK